MIYEPNYNDLHHIFVGCLISTKMNISVNTFLFIYFSITFSVVQILHVKIS